jgi:hypothetical protein
MEGFSEESPHSPELPGSGAHALQQGGPLVRVQQGLQTFPGQGVVTV